MPGAVVALLLALLAATPAEAQLCAPAAAAGMHCRTPPTPPECPATASVDVVIENHTGHPVDVALDGELLDTSATCASTAATTYAAPLATPIRCSEPVCTVPAAFTGLRPGTWINRLRVQPLAGFDVQRQARRTTFAAAATGSARNEVRWTVYAQTFTVRRKTTAAEQSVELLKRIRDARLFLESGGLSALVTFDWTAPDRPNLFPGACSPTEIVVEGSRTCDRDDCSTDADAALCWPTTGLVLDALDRNGEPGGIVVSGAAVHAPLLRITGRDNVIRGLALRGNPSPTMQADTVIFMGPHAASGRGAASGNRLEDVIVYGPGEGDAVSAQCGSHDNVVVRSVVRGAEDKGIKVVGDARLAVDDSCVADNANGGIQATLGGHAAARRNVVQHNVPGAASNGIWARGVPGIPTSTIETDANIVRFSAGRGLSATDDAVGYFRNDYVAHNQYFGARIETTAPCSTLGPVADFRGVAFACNGVVAQNGQAGLSGTCSVSKRPCTMAQGCCGDGTTTCGDECKNSTPAGIGLSVALGGGEFGCCGACSPPPTTCKLCSSCTGACALPAVTLAGGENVFVGHPVRTYVTGAHLEVGVPGVAVDASGNFWPGCTDAGCVPSGVRATNGATASATPVAVNPPGAPVIHAVWPHRPARGQLVRLWGTGFEAVATNAVSDCWTLTPPSDRCDPTDCGVEALARNAPGYKVTVRLGGQPITAETYAVTPTMLAFRMPIDCFASNGSVTVQRTNLQESAAFPLCDLPDDCAGVPDGTTCTDDGEPCTDDVCLQQTCRHLPGARAGVVCRPAVGTCDVAETCDGISGTCPADVLAGSGTVCRASMGPCDQSEQCTGASSACPPDGLVAAGTPCRAAAAACDAIERCDGASVDCPTDAIAPPGTTCRAPAGACDVAETCDGVSTDCPGDVRVPAGTSCRPVAGGCDVPEACDGSSPACPADVVVAGGTVCRPSAAACDAAEQCDGATPACPADTVAPWGTPCRDSGDTCDPVEICNGLSDACPADVPAGGTDATRCELEPLHGQIAGCTAARRQRDRLVRRLEGLLKAVDGSIAGDPCRADRAVVRAQKTVPKLGTLHERRACLSAGVPSWRAALDAARRHLQALRETTRAACPRRR